MGVGICGSPSEAETEAAQATRTSFGGVLQTAGDFILPLRMGIHVLDEFHTQFLAITPAFITPDCIFFRRIDVRVAVEHYRGDALFLHTLQYGAAAGSAAAVEKNFV